ncbi:unnamed protein product [Rhizophagus irregularis]|nr:unnamed protein product [Rhizophagus irregularis]
MVPPSFYIRPEFVKYIPQRPLFIPSESDSIKIAYEYHAPGSRSWLGYLKQQFYNDNPKICKTGKEQERALKMRERVDALNKEQQTLANYYGTSVKKLKQRQLKAKHLTDYNELRQIK